MGLLYASLFGVILCMAHFLAIDWRNHALCFGHFTLHDALALACAVPGSLAARVLPPYSNVMLCPSQCSKSCAAGAWPAA